MNKLEQAARQALEAFREYRDTQMISAPRKAIEALREALAEQAEQEPVAWAISHSLGLEFGSKYPMQETKEAAEQMARQHMGAVVVTPLYAAPISIEAAVLAEREACAKVCEPVEGSAYELGVYKTMQTLAAAIRGRSHAGS